MMKTKWEEMTVADQIKMKEIGELQLATEDEKNLKVAAHLAGIPYDEILLMPLEKVRGIMNNTEFLLHQPKANKARRKYEINGHTYTLFKDPSEMSVAQYISFQQIYREGFDKRPLEMLSIFLIPEGHKYNDGYDMEEVMNDLLALSIPDALGVCDFFTERCLKSIERMKTYFALIMGVEKLKAPKTKREAIKAAEIQVRLILDGLKELYGSLVLKR